MVLALGTYVVNRVTDKLTQLSKTIYCCRSGSAADTQAVADMVRYKLDFHRLQMDREPIVLEAAMTTRQFCYDYRDNLSAGIFVAGMLIKQPTVIGGSGSTYIYGYFDQKFKKNMTKEECVDFVKNGVALAINRDGSSGGCIRLAVISKEGVERTLIKGDVIPTFRWDT